MEKEKQEGLEQEPNWSSLKEETLTNVSHWQ
jgi:hypothetical protein